MVAIKKLLKFLFIFTIVLIPISIAVFFLEISLGLYLKKNFQISFDNINYSGTICSGIVSFFIYKYLDPESNSFHFLENIYFVTVARFIIIYVVSYIPIASIVLMLNILPFGLNMYVTASYWTLFLSLFVSFVYFRVPSKEVQNMVKYNKGIRARFKKVESQKLILFIIFIFIVFVIGFGFLLLLLNSIP